MPDPHDKPSVLDRISAFLMREPEDREQLLALLRSAHERNLLDADALTMIEGALQVSDMQARDIMIPRSQMDVIDIADSPANFIPMVMETAHSRFPVIEEKKDNVIGILLAKDLLRYYAGEEEFNVREMLRPAVFIPESKPLNVLLKEFRASRNHIAIVVDEYGGIDGLPGTIVTPQARTAGSHLSKCRSDALGRLIDLASLVAPGIDDCQQHLHE